VVVGREAIREALATMLATRPRVVTNARIVLAGEDLALYHSEWSMEAAGPTGETVRETARSADVLRRDASGAWRIAIDNPWGTSLI
jgi:ketosteroid isomerase-like protein